MLGVVRKARARDKVRSARDDAGRTLAGRFHVRAHARLERRVKMQAVLGYAREVHQVC